MDRGASGRPGRPRGRRRRPAAPRRPLAAAAVAACLVAAAPALAAEDAPLDFSAPVPDTILDAAGRGTGFTHVIAGGGLEPGLLALAPEPGLLVVRSAGGDPARPGSDPDNVLSVRVDPSDGPYAVEAALAGPLGLTRPGQAAGVYVGTGRGAHVRAVVAVHDPEDGPPGLRVEVDAEGEEEGRAWRRALQGLAGAGRVVLRLAVDPATGDVRATARLDDGEPEPVDPSGAPIRLAELSDPARADVTAGILATHGASGRPFAVAYERFLLDAPPDVRLSVGLTVRDGAPHAQVIATFSQPMDAARLVPALALLDPAGVPVPIAVTVSPDRRIAVIDPAVPLAAHAAYTALVAASASDDTGNPLPGPATLVLTPALRTPAGSAAAPGEPVVAPRAAAAPLCAEVPEPAAPAGTPGRVALTAAQLRVNGRIAQAAVRRAAAIQAWLDDGVAAEDLCGGGIGAGALGPGIVTGGPPLGGVPAGARPRPLPPRAAAARPPAPVRLTARRMLINQRIAQAALRRVGALAARLDAGLTGGDLRDGAVTAAALAPGLGLIAARVVPDPPPPTVTAPAAPVRRRAGRVKPSAAQLRINQRIAQAALRRANALARRLARGLTGEDFRPGSITAVDLHPALRKA